jgi:hypothetical protein
MPRLVNNPAQWSTAGFYFGMCPLPGTVLTCEINLNSTRTTYYHTVGPNKILNTFAYANAAIPKQDFLVITEAPGSTGASNIISSISPRKWDATLGTYVIVSLGADLAWKKRTIINNIYFSLWLSTLVGIRFPMTNMQ